MPPGGQAAWWRFFEKIYSARLRGNRWVSFFIARDAEGWAGCRAVKNRQQTWFPSVNAFHQPPNYATELRLKKTPARPRKLQTIFPPRDVLPDDCYEKSESTRPTMNEEKSITYSATISDSQTA